MNAPQSYGDEQQDPFEEGEEQQTIMVRQPLKLLSWNICLQIDSDELQQLLSSNQQLVLSRYEDGGMEMVEGWDTTTYSIHPLFHSITVEQSWMALFNWITEMFISLLGMEQRTTM